MNMPDARSRHHSSRGYDFVLCRKTLNYLSMFLPLPRNIIGKGSCTKCYRLSIARLHAHHFDKDYYFKIIHQGHLTSGIMPGSSPVPIIVYVLPVPVCRHNVDKYQPMTELETSSQLFNLQ